MLRIAAILFYAAAALDAQTESALQAFFEGKKVVARLDIPAGKEGLELFPKSQPALDSRRYSSSLSHRGPAILKGDVASIETVRVTGRQIELQILGRAYGTGVVRLIYPEAVSKTGIPAAQELATILSECLDFEGMPPRTGSSGSAAPSAAASLLKKGMTEGEVVHLLGAPGQSREHLEGDRNVVTNTFFSASERIEVDFVRNLVIAFRVRPR